MGLENYREELLQLAEQHFCATGMRREAAANRIVKDANFFERLESGGGCTVDTYVKVKKWLTANIKKPATKRKNTSKQVE